MGQIKDEPPVALKHMLRDVKPRGPRKTIPMAKMSDVGKVEERPIKKNPAE